MAAYHHLKAPAAAYSVNGIGLHHGSPGVDLLHPGYPGHPAESDWTSTGDEWDSQMIEEVWYGSSGCPRHPPIRLDKYRDEWDSQMIEEVWYGSSGCPTTIDVC
ncbi:hypothetical protein IscW_ISCW023941 [Ixodes scapularis]|uniref:Uncharacterized protein n=1 Tax=Ixodes scapularis TaxID=6945 RepID=B7QNS7_IXOSC|nr:hypothetical protein IscW_ISCW023941 [Ixodes scapularis]|eukprot:XP_002416582.1 hypothetical protein IscW_ISCW023941 [Ixodes scapularis]